jgi:VIT1/CCC1 family predicted Fe2+/Mn2+ transporter
MKRALKIGFSFGLPSGIVTTLGLMVGLNASTNSEIVVIGGILTIAIADAFSDAMGIHIAQESQKNLTHLDVWKVTLCTFMAKFIFSSIFILPVIIFELGTAVIVSVLIGLYLIFILSLYIARDRDESPHKVIIEHIVITIIVIIITHYLGSMISVFFS